MQILALGHQTAVPVGVARVKAQNHDRMAGAGLQQAVQRFGAHEGRVAIEHDGIAGHVRQKRGGLLHRMAGAALFGLQHDLRLGIKGLRGFAHGLGPMSGDNDGAVGIKRLCGPHRVVQQRGGPHGMQDFRQVGIHARALSGREDDH